VPGGSLRIALVVERFEPRGGGVEGVAWTVAHGLAAAGDAVRVLARRAQAPAAAGLRVESVPAPAFWQPLRVLLFSRRAGRAARAAPCDVVHSFARTRHQDVYRAGGGSHAEYMRRAYGPAGARLRRASPRHAVLLAIEAAVFADPHQLVQCNSEMVRRELRDGHGVPEERLALVWNGVDLERFHPRRRESERERVRAELGAPAEAPVWLLVGSELHRKGLDTALRALAAGGPRDAELWVCGRARPEPWRGLAERLGVAARVRFVGARPDVERLYAAADALLLPTRYDAFANVCLEAAAAGLPVATSGANGAADLLRETALVVEDPEDAAGFAKALDALADPVLRSRLGAAARARAEERSWARHLEELRALYARFA
jgi:UDP-glucose:(heptosyl)LPS alpha-1,3-glucosyltransferase